MSTIGKHLKLDDSVLSRSKHPHFGNQQTFLSASPQFHKLCGAFETFNSYKRFLTSTFKYLRNAWTKLRVKNKDIVLSKARKKDKLFCV